MRFNSLPLISILGSALANKNNDKFSIQSDQSTSSLSDLLSSARESLVKAEASLEDAFASKESSPFEQSEEPWAIYTLASVPRVSIRTRKPHKKLCDKGVEQIVGYLDVQHDTHADHFFFWFFESRSEPSTDPLVLWLNGGPGCSSMTGLLMELGPCRVMPGGEKTEHNKFSWNEKSNLLFLDQPVNAGFSWTDGDQVASTEDAAVDVYSFLQLFLHKHKKYSKLPFFITGESYAGHYIPAIATYIHESNSNVKTMSSHEAVQINLAGIAIGNGLTDPLVQYDYYPDMACNNSYAPILSEAVCDEMRGKAATCDRLIKACYTSGNRFACVPASIYCNNAMIGPVQKSGVNVYDVRTKCEEGNPLCYGIIKDIETYLNKPKIQKLVGADREFKGCNMDVNMKFLMNGDWMKPFHTGLPALLDAGINVLIYAGDADFICNWMGNKAWVLEMEWSGKEKFNAAKDKSWKVSGRKAGEYRVYEGLSFLKVYEAGHMVPYDQPEASLDFIQHFTGLGKKGKIVGDEVDELK